MDTMDMMDRRPGRNDSSQMKHLLQPYEAQTDPNKKPKNEGGHGMSDSSAQTSSCPPSSKPSGSSDVTAAESHEPSRSQRDEDASSCCRLDDLRRLEECNEDMQRLSFSRSHTVLVDVQMFSSSALIVPQLGRDVWSSSFVKMPCSPSSSAPPPPKSESKSRLPKLKLLAAAPGPVSRWKLISKQLSILANQKTASVDHVVEAILDYNPAYRGQWSFDALATFAERIPKSENYFSTLFPKIAALALKLPEQVKKAIPLLQKGRSASITLSQVQISCLLANAFFCTFPHRNASGPSSEYHGYPSINFSSLFGNWTERKNEKLRAIMHYFNMVTNDETRPKGLVTFERRCLGDADVPTWRSCRETVQKLHVTSAGSIETQGTGLLQVDFASSWIGGGVLGSGLVQEEILFLMNPELIVSRLFTERLMDNECLIITGVQQFSCYSGFSDSFEWAGPYEDHLSRDKWARLNRQVLAMDATYLKHQRDQYNMISITRDLNKAYCGFKRHGRKEPDIATGKWGCGAFKGDPQLKAVIQLMAAAKAGRGLAFFTFGDEGLRRSLQQLHHLLDAQGTAVGQLYEHLEDFCSKHQKGSNQELFEFLRGAVRRRSKSFL